MCSHYNQWSGWVHEWKSGVENVIWCKIQTKFQVRCLMQESQATELWGLLQNTGTLCPGVASATDESEQSPMKYKSHLLKTLFYPNVMWIQEIKACNKISIIYHFSLCLSAFTHTLRHRWMHWGNSEFNILPKDRSTCGLEKAGIDPQLSDW